MKERGTHRYILPSLFAHKIHILRRKQHALRRVKNFVDQRQPLLVLVNLIPSLAHPLAFVSFAVPEPRLHSSVPHHQMIFGCHENLEFLTRLFENSQLPPLGLISFYTSCSSSSPPHFVCSFQDFKNCHAERPMERACTRVSRTNLNIQKFILFPD